jgi:hypothetical protein
MKAQGITLMFSSDEHEEKLVATR